MRLVFDPALDGPSWPGPLGARAAVLGEAWLGPLGLLGLLETQVGLGGASPSSLERACHLSAALRTQSGFWRPSYERDPLGTSRRLLKDRDVLCLWGWQGQPVSQRLAQLWGATCAALPGVPDRLLAVSTSLGKRGVDIESIGLLAPVDSLAPLWRHAFAALDRCGVAITSSDLPSVASRGDLGNARASGFRPAGDGSLCLFRRHGVLDLADEVAATLAALADLQDVVIVGADSVLDLALGRHGLPRLGMDGDATASSHLLPLVIEAAFEPMESADLHALLVLDPGPVPRGVAARLLAALRDIPSRRNKAWQEALAAGLAFYTEGKDQTEARIRTLTTPFAAHDARLPVEELQVRLDAIRRWAGGRCADFPSLKGVIAQVGQLGRAIQLLGVTSVSRQELRRLLSDLDKTAFGGSQAQAGLAQVGQPGAILAPARIVVWWNFSRAHAPRPGRLFLTQEEEKGLQAVGVCPPDFALMMEGEAARWRRPLGLTRDALVLACPRTSESGDRCDPHPFWDEVTASLARPNDLVKLEVDSLEKVAKVATAIVSMRPLVRPVASMTVPMAIPMRESESPSSLERLIGCSFAWTLRYHAHLRPGLSQGPAPVESRLFGNLAHELLGQVFASKPTDPSHAAAKADQLFEAQMAELCEAIALAVHQVDRANLKHAVVETARILTELVAAVGADVVGSEMEHAGTALGQKMAGKMDLVLAHPDFVVDLKWGKSTSWAKLKSGTAIQLAAYAAMRREATGVSDIGVGYFVLRNQQLLTESGSRLAGGQELGAHTNQVVWAATLDEIASRRLELAAGILRAPGAGGEEVESALLGSKLRLAPGCKYCEYAGLCGRGGAR